MPLYSTYTRSSKALLYAAPNDAKLGYGTDYSADAATAPKSQVSATILIIILAAKKSQVTVREYKKAGGSVLGLSREKPEIVSLP